MFFPNAPLKLVSRAHLLCSKIQWLVLIIIPAPPPSVFLCAAQSVVQPETGAEKKKGMINNLISPLIMLAPSGK